MEKTVTIVVPVYNAEPTLVNCLDSLCGQTYPHIEIVLVNDGSTDNSLKICEEYAQKDSRIRILNQENSGPSCTRNAGIDAATGDYIMFVDSDDYIEPTMAERMVSVAEDNAVEMVICSFFEEKNGTVRRHSFSHRSGYYNEQECYAAALNIIDDNSKTRIPHYSWVRLVDRKVFEDASLRFDTTIKRSEDYLLWTQVHFRIKSMYLLSDEQLYHYIRTPSSITNSYVKDYWHMCKSLYHALLQNLPQEKEVQRRIDAMLIQRSIIAVRNAARSDKQQFNKEFNEVMSDKELRKACWKVGLVKNSGRAKLYAFMVMFNLRGLLLKVFPAKVSE